MSMEIMPETLSKLMKFLPHLLDKLTSDKLLFSTQGDRDKERKRERQRNEVIIHKNSIRAVVLSNAHSRSHSW